MAYLGMVPSEEFDRGYDQARPHHQGRQPAGPPDAGGMLVELSASAARGTAKQHKVDAAPPAVREIAWKAQCRLYRRYRALIRRGKLKTVAITAVARELAGFIWAVSRKYRPCRALKRDSRGERAAPNNPNQGACAGAWSGEAQISCNGGSGAAARGIPDHPVWPITRSTPVLRPGQPQTDIRTCVNPRIRGC